MFEGVATGAADGYARMAGKPAASLLHCGPGLANGLANLHNARRARVPLVNITGDQATYHKPLGPLLAADTEGFARGVSAWVRTAMTPAEVGSLAAEAVQAARTPPGQVATLILPSDASWNDGGSVAEALPVPPVKAVDEATITEAAQALRSGEPVVMVLAGSALMAGALADAHRIAGKTGAMLFAETFNTRIERGRGRHPIDRVPYQDRSPRWPPSTASAMSSWSVPTTRSPSSPIPASAVGCVRRMPPCTCSPVPAKTAPRPSPALPRR